MAIIVTGTPGTGKTTFAKQLADRHDMPIVGITELLRERGLDHEWDGAHNCFLVDVVQLTQLLEDINAHNPKVIIEGHLAHYLPAALVDKCYVLKCDLPVLKQRLENRGYAEDKIRENMDCEIFDVCYQESIELGHSPTIVWSSKKPTQLGNE